MTPWASPWGSPCWYFRDVLSSSVFYSPQRRGTWAAPLMTACAAGSETKTATCTGRRRPTRQVIEGQRPSVYPTYQHAWRLRRKNNPQRALVPLNSSFSLQIKALCYKGMQMRCWACVLLVIPMTHINGTLFFLGLALGEKPCILCWGEAKWRLNSRGRLALFKRRVSPARCLVFLCFHIFRTRVSQVWPHTSNK